MGAAVATQTVYGTQLGEDRKMKTKVIRPAMVRLVPPKDVFGKVHVPKKAAVGRGWMSPAAGGGDSGSKNHRGVALFDRCGIVSSGLGSTKAKLGEQINRNDVVFRMNNAPTLGFEVGLYKLTHSLEAPGCL
jgi:hypothetical protein